MSGPGRVRRRRGRPAGPATVDRATGGLAEDAVVELGSVTKAVTGLLLADAVVRGEVALDDRARRLPARRPGAAITLGRLATHTAGLPRVPLALLRRVGFLDTHRPVRAHDGPGAACTTSPPSGSAVAGRPRYSNLGAALLGQALAARAGRPTSGSCTERVLGPLGVDEVWAQGGPQPATPHGRRGRPVAAVDAGRLRAGGLPARHGPRRARPRGGLPRAAGRAGRRGGARASRATPAATARAGLGWMEAARACGGTTAARTAAARSSALRPRARRAVAAVANSPQGARPRGRALSSTRSRARSSRGPGPPCRAGRRARRCPSRARRSPTGRPPRRRAGGRTSRCGRRACRVTRSFAR